MALGLAAKSFHVLFLSSLCYNWYLTERTLERKREKSTARQTKAETIHNFKGENKSLKGSTDMECESGYVEAPFHDAWFIRRIRKRSTSRGIEIVGWQAWGKQDEARRDTRQNGIISMCLRLKKKNSLLCFSFHSWHIDSLSSLCLNCEIRLGISYEDQHMGHSFHWNWRHVDLIASSSNSSHSHTFNCDRSEHCKRNKANENDERAATDLKLFSSTSSPPLDTNHNGFEWSRDKKGTETMSKRCSSWEMYEKSNNGE